MQLSGQIKTHCPAEFLLEVLRDPAAMAQLLPEGSKLEKTDEGVYSFTMTRSVGPIRLTLPGTLTLTPRGKGLGQRITVKAGHLIGGKVDLDLKVDVNEADGQTRVGYDGDVEATGLAGRILKEHHARANSAVKTSLTRLKLYAEIQYNQKKAV